MLGAAGHTQKTSAFLIAGTERSSVRHEQPRADQTRSMITQSYQPLKMCAARTGAGRQAALLADPYGLGKDIDALEQHIDKMLDKNAVTRQGRSGASRVRRIMAGALALPDKGNVKANRDRAIHLAVPSDKPEFRKTVGNAVGKAVRTLSCTASDETPEPEEVKQVYGAKDDYLDTLSSAQRARQVAQLKQQIEELVTELRSAMGDTAGTSTAAAPGGGAAPAPNAGGGAPAPFEHAPPTDGDDCATLARHLARCDELGAELASTRKQRASFVALGKDTGAIDTRIGTLGQQLEQAEALRDKATASQARHSAPALIKRLEELGAKLTPLHDEAQAAATESARTLRSAHRHAVAESLNKLSNIPTRRDMMTTRQFVETRLAKCIKADWDASQQAIPAPLLVDIYSRALTETLKASKPNAPLDDAMHDRTMQLIAGLPGGLLAYEQISGGKIKDKARRTAHRVEGIAQTELERMKRQAPAAGGTADARKTTLELAANAAAEVKRNGSYEQCSPLERASYNAVRNGFATAPGDAGGIDPLLSTVNGRLEKMLTEWVDDAHLKHKVKVLKNKTPFSDKTLQLAATTSTLGYDDPSRPMARLDKNMATAAKSLRELLPAAGAATARASAAIAPGSLSDDQAFRLGALLLAADKSKAGRNLRPGHAALETADAAALLELVRRDLGQLRHPDAAALDLAAAQRFIDAHGAEAVTPNAMVDLVDGIKAHITVDENDAAANKAQADLLRSITSVRHLVAVDETTRIRSVDDLYDYLAPKIYQLELRGKLKTSEGGNVGLSTKAIGALVKAADPAVVGVVIPVRGELKGGPTRCAVFEIGFSTTGFEIFVGSETRTTLGGGVGVGPRFGYDEFVSGGLSVDRGATRESSRTPGVWLRLPRNNNDEATRDEALAVLQTLLGRGDTPRGDAADERLGKFLEHDGAPVMPSIIGELLANHPNLSVSSVGDYHEKTVRNETTPSAALLNVSAGGGAGAARLQIASAAAPMERRNKQFHLRDATGFMRMERSNRFSGGSTWGQANLLSFGAAQSSGPAASISEAFGILSTQRQYQESGVDTKLRYITRDGETNPVDTRVDIEDVNFKNHFARVRQHERELVELGAEQLFKGTPEADLPLHERMRLAKQRLYDVLGQAEEKSNGNSRHVFSISYRLKPSAAAVIDGLTAGAALARMHDDEAKAKRLERERDDVLRHPESFTPWKVTASERTQENEQTGVNFIVTNTRLRKTEGQRGLSSYPK